MSSYCKVVMNKTILTTEFMRKYISPTYGEDSRYFGNFVPVKGEGSMLYDKEGVGKLDLLAGLGFIYALQLHPRVTPQQVTDKCLEKGIIIGPCGNNSIRLEPHLIIDEKDFKQGLDIIAETLDELEIIK